MLLPGMDLLIQGIVCSLLIESCVNQGKRNIGDRNGAGGEKETPRPAKEPAASNCVTSAAQLWASWPRALAAVAGDVNGTEYPARVRTDRRPRPGALAFTSMVRYLPSCDAIVGV